MLEFGLSHSSVASFQSPLVATRSPHPSERMFSSGQRRSVSFLTRFFHAEGLPVGDYDHAVMEQPVEQAHRGGVLGEELSPLLEGPVGADAEGPPFIGGGAPTGRTARPRSGPSGRSRSRRSR